MKKTKKKNLENVPYPQPMPNDFMLGGKTGGYLQHILQLIHSYVLELNNSKYFAGFVMIMMNLGTKVVPVHFSKSTQAYLKNNLSKQVFVFSMAWMGTRDIYIALFLTLIFTIFSEYLFNEDSQLCIVPQKYRVLTTLIDTNNDGVITEEEIASATKILEKARDVSSKQQKQQKQQYN